MYSNPDTKTTIVLYLCDKKQCGSRCHYPECKHTTDKNHAKNNVIDQHYEYIGMSSDNKKIFVEVERNNDNA